MPKNLSKEETQLQNTQRAMGALGHMILSATEGYRNLYEKTKEFILRIIGDPSQPNPEYDGSLQDNGDVQRYIYSQLQNSQYEELINLQREWQVDVSEPLAGAARTAAAYHIKILASRRDKVVSKIRTANSRAATAISKIPPSANGMFGGDAAELEKVVKLAKDLSGTMKQTFQGSYSSKFTTNFRGKQHRGGHGGSSRGAYKATKTVSKFSHKRADSKDKQEKGGNSRGRGH